MTLSIDDGLIKGMLENVSSPNVRIVAAPTNHTSPFPGQRVVFVVGEARLVHEVHERILCRASASSPP